MTALASTPVAIACNLKAVASNLHPSSNPWKNWETQVGHDSDVPQIHDAKILEWWRQFGAQITSHTEVHSCRLSTQATNTFHKLKDALKAAVAAHSSAFAQSRMHQSFDERWLDTEIFGRDGLYISFAMWWTNE